MIDNKLGDSDPSPFRMNKEKCDVSFGVTDVRQKEGESDHKLPVEDHAAEIRMRKGFGNLIEN